MLVIRETQFFKCDVARASIIHIGADARGLGRGAQGARYKTRLVRRAVFVTRSAGDLRGSAVHLDRQISHVVIGLRDGGGAKGVGFYQVSASGQIAFVDIANHVRPSQAQQLVVAFDVFVEIFEPLAAVLGFAQFIALDHGAHSAVKHCDALGQNGGQLLRARVSV